MTTCTNIRSKTTCECYTHKKKYKNFYLLVTRRPSIFMKSIHHLALNECCRLTINFKKGTT